MAAQEKIARLVTRAAAMIKRIGTDWILSDYPLHIPSSYNSQKVGLFGPTDLILEGGPVIRDLSEIASQHWPVKPASS